MLSFSSVSLIPLFSLLSILNMYISYRNIELLCLLCFHFSMCDATQHLQRRNLPLPDAIEEEENDVDDPPEAPVMVQRGGRAARAGLRFRDDFANTHFRLVN